MRSLLTILKNILNKLSSIDSKKTEMTLLWQNASPTSNFASQNINLLLRDYDAVLICSKLNKSTNRITATIYARIGDDFCSTVAYVATNDYNLSSRIGAVTTSSISFNGARDKYVNNAIAEDNSKLIPMFILGVKGTII